MSKWLEDEERKKLLRDKEISLRLKLEEAVHTHLRQFYDLCHRVNGFSNDSLSIDRLKVECKVSHQTKRDGHCSLHTEDERRGIRISCSNQDETFIDLVIRTHTRDAYWGSDFPDNPDFSSDKEKVVIRKRCALQELVHWREDQILHAIQWMLLKSENIKDSIPGTEIMTEEAVAEAHAKRLQSEAIAAKALEGLRQEIARQKAAIADGWKEVGAYVAILAGLILLYVLCAYFANPHNANPTPHSLLENLFAVFRAVLGAVGALGIVVFGLAVLIGIGVVLVTALIQLVKTTAGMARIADLKSEITSHPAGHK
jgi:hypothetical protein